MKKVVVVGSIGALVIAGLVAAVLYLPVSPPTSDSILNRATDSASDVDNADVTTKSAPGRYEQYGSSFLGTSGYHETILFFYAPWCPECRAFERAITSGKIPDGVQVLKVDYDSSSELKKKYGVTLQTTFVKVDASGGKLSSWVGYGKDKSLAAIRDNT